MKPTEKQIDQQIKQLHCPAGKELDQRMQVLFDGAAQQTITRPAIDRMGWRIMMNSRLFKFAAVILVIATIMLGIGLFDITGSKSGLVFANVIKPFYTARCISFTILMNDKGPAIEDWVMGNRIRRTLSSMPTSISIIDLESSKILTLETNTKKASFISLKGLPQLPPNYITYLCTLFNAVKEHQNDENVKDKFTVEDLGLKTQADKQLEGIVIKTPTAEVEIWVDTKTQMPVQIVERSSNLNLVMENLVFHDEVDESLFSMEAPEGYTTTDVGQLDLQGGTEEQFIEGLRIRAQICDGVFPARIDIASYIKDAAAIGTTIEKMGLSEDEQTAMGLKLARHLLFLRFFKGKGDWHWAGNGVKLGETDKPIFWYQPADSENFRVIFGDLSVQEVSADQLEEVTRSATAQQLPAYQIAEEAGFVCKQKDTWFVQAGGQFEIHAEIELTKGPKDAPNVVIQLPYEAGVVTAVTMADKRLSFTALGKGQYQITFDPALLNAGQTDMTVVWTMPIDTLPHEGDSMYRVKLCPLMPAIAYHLDVTIESDSGWVNSKDPSKQTFTPFFCNGPEPKMELGSCGITIKQK